MKHKAKIVLVVGDSLFNCQMKYIFATIEAVETYEEAAELLNISLESLQKKLENFRGEGVEPPQPTPRRNRVAAALEDRYGIPKL